MVDVKKVLMASAGVAVIGSGLSWLYAKIAPAGIANVSFSIFDKILPLDINVKQQIVSGTDTTIGGKIVNMLQGYVPIGGWAEAALTIFLASLVVVLLASFVSSWLTLGKSETSRFALSLAVSAGIVGAVLGKMAIGIGSLGLALAMILHYGIIATIYFLSREKTSVGKEYLPLP